MDLERWMKQIKFKQNPITIILVGLCGIVYIYTSIQYGLSINAYQASEVGGMNPILVVYLHQWYRLITANFIHFDMMHIVCNVYSLYLLGGKLGLENLLGRFRFSVIIIVSMLSTTVVPCILYLLFGSGSNVVSGGISGVISGLIGAMLVLALKMKGQYMLVFKQISTSVGLMLLISVIVPSVSLVGHVSGMIGGALAMGIIMKWFPIHIWKTRKLDEDEDKLLVN